MALAKNQQREDLSAIDTIRGTVEPVDVELGNDAQYLSMGNTPLKRVVKLLESLHSIRSSEERGSTILGEARSLLNKFVQQVEMIFKNLPKPIGWRTFIRTLKKPQSNMA